MYRHQEKMSEKKTGFFSSILIFLMVFSVFANSFIVSATSHDTAAIAVPTIDGDTLILVNGGDASSIDAAIASSISQHLGIPVIYTEENKISDDLLKQLQSGVYKDVKNVVILGGPAVVSPDVQQSLEVSGTISGNYEVTRIAGTTGTGTAVEAIEYFYGPEVLDTVTLVKYEGDINHQYDDLLHTSAQLENPIIPIPSDVEGLPADVVESLNTLNVDNVNIIGDFKEESAIKRDLTEIGTSVATEISGNAQQVETQLEEKVESTIESGDKIIFVEGGEIPPIVPDGKVIYYEDKNNDNIDDATKTSLDSVGISLYNELKSKGVAVEGITYVSDDSAKMQTVENKLKAEGVSVEIEQQKSVVDLVDVAIEVTIESVDDINEEFKESSAELKNQYEQYKSQYESSMKDMSEQFKAFYVTNKDTMTANQIDIGVKILEEIGKGDAVAQWKLMHEFANDYRYTTYVNDCKTPECQAYAIEFETETTEEKLEDVLGEDKKDDINSLDINEKTELLEIANIFVPVSKEDEFQKTIVDKVGDVDAKQLDDKILEVSKDEAYLVYSDELKAEYTALGKDASTITIEQIKKEFDNRLILESKAYYSGLIKAEELDDPAKRAEVFSKMNEIDKYLSEKGVKDHQYMSPEDWKGAYDTYAKDGKLTDADVKRYDAAVTAYRTWEVQNPGYASVPTGGVWDPKTGQYSCTDPSGKVITGVYKEGAYSYANEKGELVYGTRDGEIKEYSSGNLPTNYKYDSKTGIYSREGVNIIPPSEYNEFTGAYHYGIYGAPEGVQGTCGAAGCYAGIYNGPGSSHSMEGWTQSTDGKTWTGPDGKSYSAETPYYGGSSGSSTSGSGGIQKDPQGNTWTQNTDGTWTNQGGSYTVGHETTTAGGTYTGGTYTGGTYTGGTYTGGTTTGETHTGGTYTGGSTTTTGGSTTTGGDTGGSTTTTGGSTGGDSGGSTGGTTAGHVVADIQGKGLLMKWLRGEFS